MLLAHPDAAQSAGGQMWAHEVADPRQTTEASYDERCPESLP
jgi:hypothetical protein